MDDNCENNDFLSQKQRQQLNSYIDSKNMIDDSWIHETDKIVLLKYIKTLYSNKFAWADDTLLKCLITKHYNDTINNMNKEEYLIEKETENTLDIIDRIV
jgi:hypothetical protein|tara:strand:- start:942 stop:1241 length:300 start_codon:yes stop_codon:yes gene_type:complete